MRETITDYLVRVRRKDTEKHGPEDAGIRSTREVAEYFGMTLSKARRELNKLYEAGEIEGYDADRMTLWASKLA